MSTNVSPEKLALHRAAGILGGQAALAELLGYQDRRNVWPWFNTDRRFPAEHCPLVERATREKGNVVTCEELRPDVAWDVLRLQAEADAHPAAPVRTPQNNPGERSTDTSAKAGA